MANILKKAKAAGNDSISLCERGTSLDTAILLWMLVPLKCETHRPSVVFDATHSVQLPSAQGTCSGGQREFVPVLKGGGQHRRSRYVYGSPSGSDRGSPVMGPSHDCYQGNYPFCWNSFRPLISWQRGYDMKVIAVIPARYTSTRLPGKPLADICGKPMIQHVYERVSQVPLFDAIIVATDDLRIMDALPSLVGRHV